MTKQTNRTLGSRLQSLYLEHKSLDLELKSLSHQPYPDFPKLQNLKKRKLDLKDRIANLENGMLPDIIA